MERIVVVSNRLPEIRSSGFVDEPDVPVGGLASAVLGALRGHPGSIWFGWSGGIREADREPKLTARSTRGLKLLGMSLTQVEVDEHYLGYCNRTLWPLFHSFQGRVKIRLRHEASYRRVQARFAARLHRLLRPGDLVWVHDYHLLLLGRELRQLGWTGRLGFFLHIPFPPHDLFQVLPEPRDTLEAMLHYDLVGFHVQGFLDNYVYCCARELKGQWDGAILRAGGRSQQVGTYPVGIDPNDFLPRGAESGSAHARRILGRFLRRRSLVLGVDRLDYTKGIPERLLAFKALIERHERWRKRVVLLQIASPSRVGVPEYVEQRNRIEALLGRINGELAEHDWTPIRYLYRSYNRSFLARLYREAQVGLITPLRDGMNLIAKEFVAAQRPEAPGVLILSRCAGAAQEMEEALIVNPFVPSSVADAIDRALDMPLEERRERHTALLARVLSGTAVEWGQRFLADLRGSPVAVGIGPPASIEEMAGTREP